MDRKTTGAAGFAYGVVASSIWLHVISPVHVALLVVAGGLVNQASLVWAIRRTLDLEKLWPFLIGGAYAFARYTGIDT